jgi:hypothetical protein
MNDSFCNSEKCKIFFEKRIVTWAHVTIKPQITKLNKGFHFRGIQFAKNTNQKIKINASI